MKTVGPAVVLGVEIENELIPWITSNAAKGFPISREGLLYLVQQILKETNKHPFVDGEPGREWLYSFLRRHPVISQKHVEYLNKARAAVTEHSIRLWLGETKELLGKDIVLNLANRVWNMDKSAVFLNPKSTFLLAEKGKALHDITSTSEKENVTTLIAANAEEQKASPLTIYTYDRLPNAVIEAAPTGWGIGKGENGRMVSETFYEYFANVFYPFLLEGLV